MHTGLGGTGDKVFPVNLLMDLDNKDGFSQCHSEQDSFNFYGSFKGSVRYVHLEERNSSIFFLVQLKK